MARLLLILGTIIAIGLPILFAIYFLNTTDSVDPSKDLLPYFGGLFGALLGMLALMWAALFNAQINREGEAARRRHRQSALCRALLSECSALGARCAIWSKKLKEKVDKHPEAERYSIFRSDEFSPLLVVDRHLDEIAGLDEGIANIALELQHSLAVAQVNFDESRSDDFTMDADHLENLCDWLDTIRKKCIELSVAVSKTLSDAVE